MSNSKNIHKYFSQPIFHYQLENYEEHNKELEKYIYDLQKLDPKGLSRSNQGGWHSKPFNLKDQNSPPFRFFQIIQKYVADTFKEYGWKYIPGKVNLTEMWAIINKKNSFNIEHTHPNNYLSAAYYVKAPENCGKFLVENPNLVSNHSYPKIKNENELNASIRGLNVKEGDLLFFPSYLPHKVGRNESDEDRVVISFNINVNHFN